MSTRMKVILLQDVEHLGRMGDVKEVAPGYARNYLIRRGLVLPATPQALQRLDVLRRRREQEDARRAAQAQTLAERLASVTVVIPARVGEQGRLFGSVTNQDIAGALKEQHGLQIDRRDIELEEPLRTLGTHTVSVHLGGQVRAQVRVEVVEEGQQAAASAAAAQAEAPAATTTA